MPKDGYYFDDISFDKLEGEFNPADFDPVTTISDEELDNLSQYAKHLYDNTDYSLFGWGCTVSFVGISLITTRSNLVSLGRPSDWLMMLLTEKDTCHEMMNRSVDASIKQLEQVKDAVGNRCSVWGIAADDTGTQRGEFIGPDLWVEMMKPHYTKLCDWIHKNTKWKTFFHCCGSVYNLIPHFIDAGIDILNPVQTSAANMDPAAPQG